MADFISESLADATSYNLTWVSLVLKLCLAFFVSGHQVDTRL